jgi:heme-degrading monooxygenase HmoA
VAVWSSGLWTVKPGREDEFVARWHEFATWSADLFPEAHAWLLRNREHPNQFPSVGPWPSDAAVASWRSNRGFAARIAVLRELLDASSRARSIRWQASASDGSGTSSVTRRSR